MAHPLLLCMAESNLRSLKDRPFLRISFLDIDKDWFAILPLAPIQTHSNPSSLEAALPLRTFLCLDLKPEDNKPFQ